MIFVYCTARDLHPGKWDLLYNERSRPHRLPLIPRLPVPPRCISVFIRTLPRYLTLPLRHAPTCHGSGREPDSMTDCQRASSVVSLRYLAFMLLFRDGEQSNNEVVFLHWQGFAPCMSFRERRGTVFQGYAISFLFTD